MELGTNAWLKFWSILHDFPQLTDFPCDGLMSVHLCEAPGAFISALNHYLAVKDPSIHKEWSWLGSSLNPYANSSDEAIVDDRLIKFTVDNWHFGADNNGDLRLLMNQQSLLRAARSRQKKILLVTADGGVDCSENPAAQELTLTELKLAEVQTAFALLAAGGHLVIKIFTFFRRKTCQLLQLLRICFSEVPRVRSFYTVRIILSAIYSSAFSGSQVIFYKPATSKPGNSEIYVICLSYKNMPENTTFDMLTQKDLDAPLVRELTVLARKFAAHQSEAILMNLAIFSVDLNQRPRGCFHRAKQQFTQRFLTKRPVFPLQNSFRLVPIVA